MNADTMILKSAKTRGDYNSRPSAKVAKIAKILSISKIVTHFLVWSDKFQTNRLNSKLWFSPALLYFVDTAAMFCC